MMLEQTEDAGKFITSLLLLSFLRKEKPNSQRNVSMIWTFDPLLECDKKNFYNFLVGPSVRLFTALII